MLATVDLSNPSTVFILLLGTILLMKKFAQMERYQGLRVLILTVIFSLAVLYFFLTYGSTWVDPIDAYCQPEHFCLTEM